MSFIVIPAVDIKDGRCVRLLQGRAEDETVFYEDPSEAALEWERRGAKYLHVVDLDGAFEGRPANESAIAKLLSAVSIPVEVGGGIRSSEWAERYLERGASRVVVGTRALTDTGWLAELVRALGPDKVVAGLDARSGIVAVEGWTKEGAATIEDAMEQLDRAGVKRIIHTEVATDGALEGPDMESLVRVTEAARGPDIRVIASGGVSSAEDISAIAGIGPPVEGVIVGMALYTGAMTLEEANRAAEVA
jgi:phosphoribosylformimino-5-aminoimidazole carboxamide ribotide isomerase